MTTNTFWSEAERLRGLVRFPLTRGYAKRRLGKLCRAAEVDTLPVQASIGRFPVDLDLKIPADREIYLFGLGDPRGVRAIETVMSRLGCRTAWDIGANRGNHGAIMREHCQRLFSFEPNPVEFARASALLGGDPAVTLCNLGLSDQDGELPFYINQKDSGGSSFAVGGNTPNFVAPVRTGDSVAAEHGLTDLDFLKIDVEGYETSVLRGLAATIASLRPVIAIELLARHNVTRAELERRLPDYVCFGNRMDLSSRLFMTAYRFCDFRDGRTYMSALLVPREKLDRLRDILP